MSKSVFISSTSVDLLEHRLAVKRIIERLDMRPIDMANFGSQSGDAKDVSLKEVRKANIFIGIIAHRYGYVPEGSTKSVTEQEFDEATRLKMPRLMYLVDPTYDWPKDKIEHDKIAQQKLKLFKSRIEKSLVRSLFSTPENLASQVASDLSKERDKFISLEKRLFRLLSWGIGILLMFLAILIGVLIITAPDDEKAGIAQADRIATNQSLDIKNQTATASLWTLTPIPTAITPSPTPLEAARASENEIVIVLAPFEQTSGTYYEPHKDIFEVIESVSQKHELENVRIVTIGHSITNANQARDVGEIYSASVVIYGRIAPGGITVHYDINPVWQLIQHEELNIKVGSDFDFVLRISRTDVVDFEAYLYEGVDVEYILGITTGFASFFQEDFLTALNSFSIAESHLDNKGAEELDTAILYLYLGSTYFALEEYEQAIYYYDQAMLSNSQPIRWGWFIYYHPALAYYLQGFAYLELEQYENAINSLTNAIELMPDRKDQFVDQMSLLGGMEWSFTDYNASMAYANRATAFFHTEQYEEAIADYTQTITLNSVTNTEPLLFEEAFTPLQDSFKARLFRDRGLNYLILTDYENAEHDFRQAILLDPENAKYHYLLGKTLFDLQQPQEAVISFSQAISHNYEPVEEAYIFKGVALIQLGEYEQAIQSLEAITDVSFPGFAEAAYWRGAVYLMVGEPTKSIPEYELLVDLDLDQEFPPELLYYLIGFCYRSLGDYENAISYFTESVVVNPAYVGAYNQRGNIYRLMGETDLAVADYTTTIETEAEIMLTYSLPFTGGTYHILQLQEKVDALKSRGQIFYDRGEIELAYSDWREYVNIMGEEADESIVKLLNNHDSEATSSPE